METSNLPLSGYIGARPIESELIVQQGDESTIGGSTLEHLLLTPFADE
jgi:hypothetical protein